MQREGVFGEMKRRRFYEKRSEQAIREKSEAARRAGKLAREAGAKKKKTLLRNGTAALPLRAEA
jgi:small subunit ribosomal protein S21